MVGVAGFKPTTSPTPRVRANQAAPYSENKNRYYTWIFKDLDRILFLFKEAKGSNGYFSRSDFGDC